MLKVVETFSGIGSQAKALRNIGIDFEVLNTVDWDINAIYAYDIIHNGPQNLDIVKDYSKEELVELLSRYNLSTNGKEPLKKGSLERMREETLKKIYAAIIRTKNLVNIQDVKATDLPFEIDLLTYSFPCQDLSISGFWHGNSGGIERNGNNRSSMLWEIERILLELNDLNHRLPKFLLMENVTSIRSDRHIDNFNEWKNILEGLGYENEVYDLCAYDFGIPQMRKRTFMISVFVDVGDTERRNIVQNFFEENNLEVLAEQNNNIANIDDFLKLDYDNRKYREEAIQSTPNRTESRGRIFNENPIIHENGVTVLDTVRTITTKQDRNPNSGVLTHDLHSRKDVGFKDDKTKAKFRFLTPRECFLFMGFDETDFDLLLDNNFFSRKNTQFLSKDKLVKLAGNSIVVNVLEAVFTTIYDLNNILY